VKTVLKQALWWASPTLFKRVTKPSRGQTFSIGVFTGSSPMALANPEDVINPVMTREHVTDAPAAFVADPFMVRHEDLWYMFFEVLNSATRLGQISVATSPCGFKWTYAGCVLKEPFHLAYPQVFHHDGHFYMVPDTPDQGVVVYRASAFPSGWQRVDTLLKGGRFSDSSVFQFDGGWWMLTAWSQHLSDSKSLRLFFADDPLGPWHEHPQSPIVAESKSRSRPAGRVVAQRGRMLRFAQVGYPEYGSQVRAFEIVELTRSTYREQAVGASKPILQGCGNGWNAGGMHHVDAHQLADGAWIACVDGWYAQA
jgi:hypothetical protein